MMYKTWIGYNKVHHKKAKLKSADRALSACTKSGFSLVEMLMALLVASLLMAALAPVMTRKMHENLNINVNSSGQSKGWRLYTYSQDCDKAEGEENVCEFKDFKVPQGVYAINLVMVSGGGGGAGATASNITPSKTVTKYTKGEIRGNSDYDEQIIPITEYMKDVKISRLVGGGGGGGGGAVKTNLIPSPSVCADYGNSGKKDTVNNTGANFATFDEANNLCVTKFNQKAASGCYNSYTHVPSSSNKVTCTSKAVDNENIFYSYSGCNRWICTYSAAVNACSALASSTGDPWRLPTSSETNQWANNTSVIQNLMLCNMHSNNIVSQCTHSSVGLNGNYAGCPYKVWGDGANAFTYGDPNCATIVNGVTTYTRTNYQQFPYSVRCVISTIYSSYSASGGGSGSLLSDIDISEYVKQAGAGGSIVLQAGRGGKGGDGAASGNLKASNGIAGYKSCVKVLTPSPENKVVYGVCAYQGNGGNAGDAAGDTGKAGSAVSSYSYCEKTLNGTNWEEINCTKSGNASIAGIKTVGNTSNGGKGGDSNFPSISSGGGDGAMSTSADGNGFTPSYTTYAGAGGGGGTGIYTTGGNVKTGKGGDGAGGAAEITYKNEYAGAGGGAGSGGILAVISNLSLSSDSECTIHVGGGGAYGSGFNGSNGGHTSIKCGNNAQEYKIFGGNGGKIGVSGSESVPDSVGGLAGSIAKVNSNILQLGNIASIVYGEGYDINTSNDIQNKINTKLSAVKNIGGSGGNSGSGAIGGCGGLKEDIDNNCLNTGNASAMPAEFIAPIYSSLITGDYGKAGAGGGGGGWSRELSPKQGTGSAGQAGYLFLWWDQT